MIISPEDNWIWTPPKKVLSFKTRVMLLLIPLIMEEIAIKKSRFTEEQSTAFLPVGAKAFFRLCSWALGYRDKAQQPSFYIQITAALNLSYASTQTLLDHCI